MKYEQNPGMRQESNWMQNNNRIFLGNQARISYQNQYNRQTLGMEQEKHWQQNQNQNFQQQEQMTGSVNPWGGGYGNTTSTIRVPGPNRNSNKGRVGKTDEPGRHVVDI